MTGSEEILPLLNYGVTSKLCIGVTVFEAAVREGKFLIDKSSFIKTFFYTGACCIEILLPCGFGKSFNLSMLKYFLDENIKDQATTFEKFAIMKEDEIVEKHMGKHPVAYLSLGDCQASTWAQMLELVWLALSRMMEPHIKAGDIALSEFEYLGNERSMRLCDVFAQFLRRLHETRNKKVVVIVDDFDVPMRVKMSEEDSKARLSFFLYFYSSALKDNVAVKKACLAGTHHVSFTDMYSGFNNVCVYPLGDNARFGDSFGFSETEVKCFLRNVCEVDEARINQDWNKQGGIKDHVGGYFIGKYSLVNPRSFMSYIGGQYERGECIDFLHIFNAYNLDFADMIELIQAVMSDGSRGRTRIGQLRPEFGFTSERCRGSIAHFMCMIGYLTCQSGYAWIPNGEMLFAWKNLIAGIGGFPTYDEALIFSSKMASALCDLNCGMIKELMTIVIKRDARMPLYLESILTIQGLIKYEDRFVRKYATDQAFHFEGAKRSVVIGYTYSNQSDENLGNLAKWALRNTRLGCAPVEHDVLLIGCAIDRVIPSQVAFRFRTERAGESRSGKRQKT